MAMSATAIEAADELAVNADRFQRHIRVSGRAHLTESPYLQGVADLTALTLRSSA
jgi:hypothetical protein